MVMKKSAMGANLRQSIRKSFGRYIAIVAIIALGSALFMGLLMTKSDMVATGQVYMDQQDMFDLRLMNSYGWTEEYVEEIAALEGIEAAEGVTYIDLIAAMGDGEEGVHRFYTIPQKLDRVSLRAGRMPEGKDECLADGFRYGKDALGKTITISESNAADSLEAVTERTFTVVGIVASPLYMDMNRGTTTVGSGTISSFVYVPEGALDLDYYPEIHVTIPGSYKIYTDAYNDAMTQAADSLGPKLEPMAQRRLEEVVEQAEEAYWDGLEQYKEGYLEFLEGKEKAQQELQDAEDQLNQAQQDLEDNEKMLTDGEKALEEAKAALLQGEKTLEESRKTLANAKAAAYKNLSESTTSLMSQFQSLSEEMEGLKDSALGLSTELITLNGQILPLETQKTSLEVQISQTQTMLSILDTSIQGAQTALEIAQANGADEETLAQLEQELENLKAQKAEYEEKLAQQQAEKEALDAQLAPLYAKREELQQKQDSLDGEMEGLQASLDSITQGLLELVVTQSVMDNEFAAASAQLEAGEAQLAAGKLELELQEKTIAEGWKALEEGKQTLAEKWKEYEDGKAEVQEKLAESEKELKSAEAELIDARRAIRKMTENDIIILDRTSNVGYNNLESSSDIVQGVSRVIPVFFILVASLVCITTMTRMIEEERTQIGTLKALGYSSNAIISKYLLYSGSGAILGCGLGVAVGSAIFPMILWQAYCIMLYIQPNVVLTINWPLCLGVVALYTGTILLVTWYCCRRTLREEPAELIRPKSPDPGKKVIFEYFPFWKHIGFLNKVTIRNVFRYRQRLAMMLVGIGGCTALLVTGFGLRDSIMNVVDYQFQEVALYDMEIYFREDMDGAAQAAFRREVSQDAEKLMFFQQSSVDISFDAGTKEVYMLCAEEGLQDFIDLHQDETPIPMPEVGQVVLSAGVAENLGISQGDQVTIRNADLQIMTLTVSGIYDNHVYNYAIITPKTLLEQWDQEPELQMAYLTMKPDRDVHALGAKITGLDSVMNVIISQDLADMVGGMMDAMNLVILVIVFCAGLLAVIVLYNLTNININERIREIATIKVLGFNAGETGAYVFKENLALTVAGSLFGLLLGRLMLLFVMSQIRIDMVWFKALVEARSYLWSLALTMLSAIVVDFIFYFRLDKINMAEALKSVE